MAYGLRDRLRVLRSHCSRGGVQAFGFQVLGFGFRFSSFGFRITAHTGQSRPDSGLGVQVQVLKTCSAFPSSLASGCRTRHVEEMMRFADEQRLPLQREEGNQSI